MPGWLLRFLYPFILLGIMLAALGVEDFGLFNLVGGVISMLGFLNNSMAMATQRFMSLAQGAEDS